MWGTKCCEQGEGWQTLSNVTCEALLRTECGSAGRLQAGRGSSPRVLCTVVAEHPAESNAQPRGEWQGSAPASLHPSFTIPLMANASLNWAGRGAGERAQPPALQRWMFNSVLPAASSVVLQAGSEPWDFNLLGLLKRKNGKKREKGRNWFQLSVS